MFLKNNPSLQTNIINKTVIMAKNYSQKKWALTYIFSKYSLHFTTTWQKNKCVDILQTKKRLYVP